MYLCLLGDYSCLTGFACSRSIARSVHLLCSAIVNSNWLPRDHISIHATLYADSAHIRNFTKYFRVGPGDEATQRQGVTLSLVPGSYWAHLDLAHTAYGNANQFLRLHNTNQFMGPTFLLIIASCHLRWWHMLQSCPSPEDDRRLGRNDTNKPIFRIGAISPTLVSPTPISPTYYHSVPFRLLMQNVTKTL